MNTINHPGGLKISWEFETAEERELFLEIFHTALGIHRSGSGGAIAQDPKQRRQIQDPEIGAKDPQEYEVEFLIPNKEDETPEQIKEFFNKAPALEDIKRRLKS